MGDPSGRIANVVMLGILSRITPFDLLPEALWLKALQSVGPKPAVWAANRAAFQTGRGLRP